MDSLFDGLPHVNQLKEAKKQRDELAILLYKEGKPTKYITTYLEISQSQLFRILHQNHVYLKNSSKARNWPALTQRQMEIVNGGLLGDASIISGYHKNGRFVKSQTTRSLEYLEWHFMELKPFSKKLASYQIKHVLNVKDDNGNNRIIPDPKKKLPCSQFRTAETEFFGQLRRLWYPSGIKIVPPDIRLTPLTIAVWFCDDGTCSPKDHKASFATHCFSTEDLLILLDELKRIGIKANSHYARGKQRTIGISSRSFFDFMDMVKPLIVWECFQYKADLTECRRGRKSRGQFMPEYLHFQI